MSRRHCATSSCRAAARLMIGMSDVLGTASPAGTGGGRAAGKQIVHTGSRSPAWRKATHSLAAKAKLETLRLPGGLDGVEIGAARGIGLARRPGGPPGPLLAPDGKQAAKFAQRFGMIVDADVEIGKILGKGPRGDGHGEGAGGRIMGDDRPGHRRQTLGGKAHFFSIFQKTGLVATNTPTMFLRKAAGCKYWPKTTWVVYSAARCEMASASVFCLAGSFALA